MPLPPTDTRSLFRPLCGDIVELLRTLSADDWERKTVAGHWRVRDVAAHLLDTALRRLSFQRDGFTPPATPGVSPAEDLASFINALNATWVAAAQRLSPRVLTDLYALASTDLAGFMETLDLSATALFPVSWAGDTRSPQWLDIGREFTEVWHHGSQIRDAIGAGAFSDAGWLRAVVHIGMHALPHAYRDVPCPRPGVSIAIEITGAASSSWTLHCRTGRWDIDEGRATNATATATMTDDVAWRLLFNALPPSRAASLVQIAGDAALALPLLRARSVVL